MLSNLCPGRRPRLASRQAGSPVCVPCFRWGHRRSLPGRAAGADRREERGQAPAKPREADDTNVTDVMAAPWQAQRPFENQLTLCNHS